MNYLLSIIIPTKNRYYYLKHCIESLEVLDSDLTEIIIQDNSSDNKDFIKFIKSKDYNNVKYFYESDSTISQTKNSELALEKATGEYVCYIGDDDSVTSWIIDVALWMKENKSEGIVFKPANYSWPDLEYRVFNFPNLIIPKSESGYKKLDPLNELNNCLNEGGKLGNLPKVYHGIISKSALNRVKFKFGNYFPGASPDMANAVALSLVIKNYHSLSLPIIVSGTSYYSAGGMGARGQHKAELSNVQQLPKGINNQWIATIPKIWTGETIWAHSCLEALNRVGREDLIQRFNLPKLYAKMIVMHSDCWEYVKPCIVVERRYVKTFLYVPKIFLKRAINFIKNLINVKFKRGNNDEYEDIDNVRVASSIVDTYIKNLKVNIRTNREVN